MKREYNFEKLARRHGFNVREIEKVCRISDLREDISAVKFLKDRLSLYGGTALRARRIGVCFTVRSSLFTELFVIY